MKTHNTLNYTWRLFFLMTLLFTLLSDGHNVARADPESPQDTLAATPRRVNIPLVSGNDWSQQAIFWLGVNENKNTIPGRNYTDVRIAYTQTELHLYLTVIDYYLWYDNNQTVGDLTQNDAVVVYFDTGHNRTAAPQTDDYYFLVGARHMDTTTKYQRQARGNGTGWNTSWSTTWTQNAGMQWSDTGPNNNSGNIDYGWMAEYHLPWSAFGLSGPPATGTLWGMGVYVYDRDNSGSGGMAAPQGWPETFSKDTPSTWGDLHFGDDAYQPPSVTQTGSVTIRAASPTDNTVEDAWMGGGGGCSSGHNGGTEINHGNHAELYLGSESVPTHFPCFNKTFLRFQLGSVPTGKVILSAKMTLYHWGNAGDPSAPNDEDHGHPSYAWLYTINDAWDEMTIHWNNAPLAGENLDLKRMEVLTAFPGWDKTVAYEWDVTKAVAEAYQAGQPVSLAVYDAAGERNTSKYMIGSETENWNANNRPKLTITYGSNAPTVAVTKQVSPSRATTGTTVNYTLTWTGIGKALTLTDTLPQGLSAPTNLQASTGTASYNASTRQITWSGSPTSGQAVQLTYQCTVQSTGTSALINTAVLSGDGSTSTANASICVNCRAVYLPMIRK